MTRAGFVLFSSVLVGYTELMFASADGPGLCVGVQQDTDFSGSDTDIEAANGTYSWHPANLETCCASCAAFDQCKAWTFGSYTAATCAPGEQFKAGEGCCWLKKGQGQVVKNRKDFQSGTAAPEKKSGGHGFTIFCVLLLVAIILYLAIGMTWNYKKNEKRGVEMVPNLEFWKKLPGRVAWGCGKASECCVALYLKCRGIKADDKPAAAAAEAPSAATEDVEYKKLDESREAGSSAPDY